MSGAVYAAENADGLLAERKPDAEAAAAQVQAAVEALAQAQKQWDAAQSDLQTILRLAGRSSEGLPQFPPALAELTRHAPPRRADRGAVAGRDDSGLGAAADIGLDAPVSAGGCYGQPLSGDLSQPVIRFRG